MWGVQGVEAICNKVGATTPSPCMPALLLNTQISGAASQGWASGGGRLHSGEGA